MTFTGTYREPPAADLLEIIGNAENELNALANSHVLISGGTGFVGSWLSSTILAANKVLQLGAKVTLTTRNRIETERRFFSFLDDDLQIVEIDVGSSRNPFWESKHDFTHIIHGATPRNSATDEFGLRNVIVGGAHNLLDMAARLQTPPVFMHLSSGAVYGTSALTLSRIPEGWTPPVEGNEFTAYAKSKIEVEALVSDATLKGAIVGTNPRLFAFLGPFLPLDAHFAVGNFVRDSLNRRNIEILGSAKTQRSYMYPTDMAEWLLALLSSPTLKPIHVGSDQPVSIAGIAELVRSEFGGTAIDFRNPDVPSNSYVPETTLTSSLLGVGQRVNMREGLRRWHDWLST